MPSKIACSLFALVSLIAPSAAPAAGDSYAADLRIVKSVEPVTVSPGGVAVFTLGVENLGPDTAQNTVVTDTLPAGLVYVSNNCGASWAAPTLTWQVGSMPDGAIAFCEITVVVEESSSNTATVVSDYFDPVADNNAAAAAVTAAIVPQGIPALESAGVALLGLGLAAAALFVLRRR